MKALSKQIARREPSTTNRPARTFHNKFAEANFQQPPTTHASVWKLIARQQSTPAWRPIVLVAGVPVRRPTTRQGSTPAWRLIALRGVRRYGSRPHGRGAHQYGCWSWSALHSRPAPGTRWQAPNGRAHAHQTVDALAGTRSCAHATQNRGRTGKLVVALVSASSA